MERPSFIPKDATKRRRLGWAAGGAATLVTAAALAGCSSPPTPPLTELPRSSTAIGGIWDSPKYPVTIVKSPTLTICVEAYAPKGEPPIEYVDITVAVNGGSWHKLEPVEHIDKTDQYCVTEVFARERGISLGSEEQISFDPVNTANQQKLSPQGVHIIFYIPDTIFNISPPERSTQAAFSQAA